MSDFETASPDPFLICRSGLRSCGFPLHHVVETMRRLPVEAVPDMPHFMAGVSIIRGATVPVVNLAKLLGECDKTEITRFVSVKAGSRTLAFAVASVVGVGQPDAGDLNAAAGISPLLGEVDTGLVKAIGIRDAGLFSVLEASRVIPETVWQNWESRGLLI